MSGGDDGIKSEADALLTAPASLEFADFDRVPPRGADFIEENGPVLLQLLPSKQQAKMVSNALLEVSSGNSTTSTSASGYRGDEPLTVLGGEDFETDVALGLLRLIALNASASSNLSPLIVIGGCCRVAHRFNVSKALAINIALGLHLLPVPAAATTTTHSASVIDKALVDALAATSLEPVSWGDARWPRHIHDNDYF